MPTLKIANGKTFEVSADQTILESADKSKINLPYSCRIGRCPAYGSESMIRHPRDFLIERCLSVTSFFSDAFVPSGL